jgi:hypothetical protein
MVNDMKNYLKKYTAEILVLLALLLLGGSLSLWLGQDKNWDLQNYHLYNAWAFLTGRLRIDLFPAEIQTYYNPLLDVPYYLTAVKWLPGHPKRVAFLAGLPYGALVFFTWLIARKITSRMKFGSSLETEIVAVLATVFGVTGTASISQLGTTFNEIQQAAINLAGLFILLHTTEALTVSNKRNWLLAVGALFGLSAGLKLTSLTFTCGAALALFLTTRRWKPCLLAIFYFGLAWLAMFGLVEGWWMYKVWQLTGNPMFPYFNNIFASAWFPPTSTMDMRFLPKTVLQAIFYPFYWLTPKVATVAEFPFSDFRFFFAYLGIIILAASVLYHKLTRKVAGRNDDPAGNSTENTIFYMFGTFVVVSYVFWELTSSIIRYAVCIEVLSGLFFALVIAKSGLIPKSRISLILIIVLGVVMVTTHYLDWGRIDYSSKTFKIESPTLPDHSMVLLVGAPISYVAPFIRTADGGSPEFIGINEDYYVTARNYELGKLTREAIQDHQGPIYVINRPEVWEGDFLHSAFEISIDAASVQKISTNIDAQLNLFAVNR